MKLNLKKCESFIISLYNSDGSFSFSNENRISNLLSTCFGVLSLSLLNKTDKIDKTKTIDYILKFYDKESGYFIDLSIKQKKHKKKHDWDYLMMQKTDFALLALQCLNYDKRIALPFLKDYKKDIESFLKKLNWSNPWSCSNKVMFILNFLIYESKNNKKYALEILSWLNLHQEEKTGFWNLGNKVSLFNQMAGAYHFMFYYTYFKTKPNYINKIIDSTLLLQNYDSLFSYAGGGGSCEDLDAIDLLCRESKLTNYHKTEIKTALENAYNVLVNLQNEDGGFCWAKRDKINFRQLTHLINLNLLNNASFVDFKENIKEKLINLILTVLNPRLLIWRQGGIKKMQIKLASSDLWSTYARLLTISLIEERYPQIDNKIKWNYLNFPGIGYVE